MFGADAFSVLTLATEDASPNHGIVCQGFINFWADNLFFLFPFCRRGFLLTTEGHIDVNWQPLELRGIKMLNYSRVPFCQFKDSINRFSHSNYAVWRQSVEQLAAAYWASRQPPYSRCREALLQKRLTPAYGVLALRRWLLTKVGHHWQP